VNIDHSNLKDIEWRIERLGSDFKILVNRSSQVSKAYVLDQMEQAASEIVEAIQRMKQAKPGEE
jgi:hypothetical protein